MKRKQFLTTATSLLATAALPSLPASSAENFKIEEKYFIPPYLKYGDIIGITSPAGYITLDEIKPAMRKMESWGFKVKIGETIGKRDFTFGGTDEERTKDFQQMLDDPEIKAIMCARGGYGAVRIIDKLKWDKFKIQPKWIIGFSDITVFHSHLTQNLMIASVHSKMCNSFPEDWSKAEPVQVETIESIKLALSGKKLSYNFQSNNFNRQGKAEGILAGGNLKMLETLAGTASDLQTDGKLLFVEDTGEYLYNIDRMFWNLQRTGKLEKLAGLIVGGFRIKPTEDPAEEFGKNLNEIVLEKVKNYAYPVCFDFPVGHIKNNYALKCAVQHRLLVSTDSVSLSEL